MKQEWLWIGFAAALAAAVGVALGFGVAAEVLVISILFLPLFAWMGQRLADDDDAHVLPLLLPAAYLAKIVGGGARYLVLQLLYGGIGDSVGYHNAGLDYAATLRDLAIPDTSGVRVGFGTIVTRLITAGVYAIYSPETLLGGFIIFSIICFAGQLLFYLAVRDAVPRNRRFWLGLGIFFLPTMVFWPSSVGKDALMVFGIGLATFGLSKLYRRLTLGPMVLALTALTMLALIRAHVAALIVGAFVVGLLFNRRRGGKLSLGRATVSLVLAMGLMGGAAWALTSTLRLDLSEEGLEELASTAESQTDTGGSSVEGSAVRGPQDLPEATLRVLFRPLIYEASGAQLASGVEGTVLLLVFIWRLPTLGRNFFRMRHKPILLMSAAYTFGFIIVFSPFLNLGILARQRSQLMPFLIAWLIGAGWGEITAPGEEQADVPQAELPDAGETRPESLPAPV